MRTFDTTRFPRTFVVAVLILFVTMYRFGDGSEVNNSSEEFWSWALSEDNRNMSDRIIVEDTRYIQSGNATLYGEDNPNHTKENEMNEMSDSTFVTKSPNDIELTEVQSDTSQNDQVHDRCAAKLYSCRGRCDTAPRLACSCHQTCIVYGNCCEDFQDACPSLVLKQERLYEGFVLAETQCVDNNFLIASCKKKNVTGISETDSVFSATNININGGHDDGTISRIFDGLKTADIQWRCLETASNEPVQRAPVTDTNTRLHFKNIFCAVCNGVLDIEIWHGLTHCKYGDASNTTNPASVILKGPGPIMAENRTILPDVQARQILSSENCQTFWRPKIKSGGLVNPCLHKADIKSHSSHSSEAGLRTHNTGTDISQGVIEENIANKYSSLHLEWRNVTGEFGGEFNQSYFQEKCETLNSFVEHPTDSESRYKNKYCFMLDSQSTSTNRFCEPSLSISDDGGVWYTMTLAGETGKSQGETLGNGQDVPSSGGDRGERWVVYEGIEESFWDELVSDNSLSRCDGRTALVFEGKCRSKSFYLTMKTNFTFIRSSLIRGDFNMQVEKFTDHLVETFVDRLSNRTACVVVSFKHSKVPGSSVKFQSYAEFQCLDIQDVESNQGNSLTATPASLMDGGSISDDEVNHYIMFVTNTLRIVVEKEKVVTLPVTIELAPCIFPDKDADDKVRGYCTKVKNVWRAARKVNTVIGGLSLEGILTIICCILSVFGLIIRLALQNVVPFYKSYPGKIQFGLCLSLFLAYALFMLGGLVQEGSKTCMVLAIFTHVAFLSALFWMNVTAFEIWRTFRTWRNQVVSRGHASLILSVFYAVGIPLLLVITALLVEEFIPHSQFSPSYGEHVCWLNGSMAVAFYFVTPCCIICCVNAIFVGLTLRSLRRQRTSISEFKKSNATTAVTDVGIVIKIILLVGITWLLGLLAALVDNEWLWILFTVINASLGFLISVVLVFNKRVYYTVRAKCLCYTNETISVVSTQVQRH